MTAKKLNITLDEELIQELEQIAKDLGEKKSRLIAKALILLLELSGHQSSRRTFKKLEEGKTEVIPANEVSK